MGDINLEVWDATGNKRLNVQVPDDVAVERIWAERDTNLEAAREARRVRRAEARQEAA